MLRNTGYFITGTDTGVGKTYSTLSLMHFIQQQGLLVGGMKPVAAGCQRVEGALRNTDAVSIQQQASVPFSYDCINPYAFEFAVSPHIACRGQLIDLHVIRRKLDVMWGKTDCIIVEGAGGWLSPLDAVKTNRDLAVALQLPVILTVGLRLGCINQALLTWGAIRSSRVHCVGWVAVQIDDNMEFINDNIDYLKERIEEPLLAHLPYLPQLNVERLATNWRGFSLKPGPI